MGTVEIAELRAKALGALVGGRSAWRGLEEVAGAIGREEGETTDLLAELDVDGWLAVWEFDDRVVVTLSALGAERLGVRLIEPGEGREPRWAKLGDPEPSPPRARNTCARERAADLAFAVDPQPTPDLAAERAELAAIVAGDPAETDKLPRPSLLVGQGLTPWPGPSRAAEATCPACGSAPLPPHAYCLCCDAWGLDGRVITARPCRPARHPRRRSGPPNAPDDAQARKSRRKSRRRRKLEARIAADRRRARPPVGGGIPLA